MTEFRGYGVVATLGADATLTGQQVVAESAAHIGRGTRAAAHTVPRESGTGEGNKTLDHRLSEHRNDLSDMGDLLLLFNQKTGHPSTHAFHEKNSGLADHPPEFLRWNVASAVRMCALKRRAPPLSNGY